MCTISWLRRDDGFDLMCNRDERHSRKRAFAPAMDRLRGVSFISPKDGDHGGTWIGVNQFGVALCLLNRYEAEKTCRGDRLWSPLLEKPFCLKESTSLQTGAGTEAPPLQEFQSSISYTSRGLLVKNLLDASSLIEALSRVEGEDLSRFQPFTLVALEPGENCLMIEWTGRELLTGDGEQSMPLVSSSFDPSGARSARKETFEKLARSSCGVDAQMLMSFHQSHAPARGPLSPCMHRDDARTVSFSHIKVAADSISFFYFADSPCQASFENADEAIKLERSKRAR
ncbi:MAG: NRDE family protein [Acidobacteriota bacterium]